MTTTRDAKAKMAATMARAVVMVPASDKTERVAGCRLTHGPIPWASRRWTGAGVSILYQVRSRKFEKLG